MKLYYRLFYFLLIGSLLIACSKDQSREKTMNAIEAELTLVPLDYDPILNTESEYVVVIGDIQEYTKNNDLGYYWAYTMSWIAAQKKAGVKINYILQTGDLTDNNTYDQWYRYAVVRNFLPETPFIACPGNHDYKWNKDGQITNRSSSLFDHYIHYKDSPTFGIEHEFEENSVTNVILKCQIQQQPYYIISLEFGPRDEVVEWAKTIVQANPDKKYLLLTHAYLDPKGQRADWVKYLSYTAKSQFQGSSSNDGEDIWQKLVRYNDNVILVLCGHNGFTAKLLSENNYGTVVPQIMFNNQYQANGGDTWIQFWEFPPEGNTAKARTYNVLRKKEEKASSANFEFTF